VSLRQQQVAVFLGTVLVVFGIFAVGLWLVAQRLTAEATLQTALLMARQVEIALADSLRQAQVTPAKSSSSFWSFLDNLLPRSARSGSASPRTEVRGLMRAYVDRSGSIEAMWVLNAEGKILYSSRNREENDTTADATLRDNLRRGVTTISSKSQGNVTYYDVLVPLQMPKGVRGPGGLRLWINPADWTELLSGLWHQLALLFVLGGAVALMSAFLTTTLYTRRFRLISETLRQAEAGTYQTRPRYGKHDEVGASLDLIDRLVMKQRKSSEAPAPMQRLAVAARTLAHEVRTPLNALAVHLELIRNPRQAPDSTVPAESQQRRSLAALDAGVRQVDRLVRDFTDYTAPVNMERKPLDLLEVLEASLEAVVSTCAAQKISLIKDLTPGPWRVQGDGARLRQAFDNLLRNAMEAQPNGGSIRITARKNEDELILDFADAGPGISPERRANLFDFGNSTKAGGSGIGLPLSQLIIESHGGSLVYQEGNGSVEGATFRLTLPTEERAR
jgi:signal transduction histidine kinase